MIFNFVLVLYNNMQNMFHINQKIGAVTCTISTHDYMFININTTGIGKLQERKLCLIKQGFNGELLHLGSYLTSHNNCVYIFVCHGMKICILCLNLWRKQTPLPPPLKTVSWYL